jgi:hypothetical protein
MGLASHEGLYRWLTLEAGTGGWQQRGDGLNTAIASARNNHYYRAV